MLIEPTASKPSICPPSHLRGNVILSSVQAALGHTMQLAGNGEVSNRKVEEHKHGIGFLQQERIWPNLHRQGLFILSSAA